MNENNEIINFNETDSENIYLLERDIYDLQDSFIIANRSLHEHFGSIETIEDYISHCKNDLYISNMVLEQIRKSNASFNKIILGTSLFLISPVTFMFGGFKLGLTSIGLISAYYLGKFKS